MSLEEGAIETVLLYLLHQYPILEEESLCPNSRTTRAMTLLLTSTPTLSLNGDLTPTQLAIGRTYDLVKLVEETLLPHAKRTLVSGEVPSRPYTSLSRVKPYQIVYHPVLQLSTMGVGVGHNYHILEGSLSFDKHLVAR